MFSVDHPELTGSTAFTRFLESAGVGMNNYVKVEADYDGEPRHLLERTHADPVLR